MTKKEAISIDGPTCVQTNPQFASLNPKIWSSGILDNNKPRALVRPSSSKLLSWSLVMLHSWLSHELRELLYGKSNIELDGDKIQSYPTSL